MPSTPVLDIESAVKHLGKKKETVKEYLVLLMSGLEEDLKATKQQHKDNDWQEIKDMAHKWKGGASYCGARCLEQVCQQLGVALRTDYLKENMKCSISSSFKW